MALTYQQLLTAVPLVIRAGNVPNIVGEAGVGKSALVREVADRLQARLFTTVVSLSEKGAWRFLYRRSPVIHSLRPNSMDG